MTVIFMGTPDFAVPTLRLLILNSNHKVVSVVTTEDKPRGRGRKLLPSPVKVFAESKSLPILQPSNLSEDNFLQKIRDIGPDIFVVVAFRILPEELFSIPKHGAINLHASLLPQYRGAAPIEWALINGECQTGLTTFKIDRGIDTGGILMQDTVEIRPEDNSGSLSLRMANTGAQLVKKTLDALEAGTVTPELQISEKKSSAPKITSDLLHIDWEKPATEIVNLIRGLSPEPGAYIVYQGRRIKVFEARLQEEADGDRTPGTVVASDQDDGLIISSNPGSVEILLVQREGKRQMPARDLLKGMQMTTGDVVH